MSEQHGLPPGWAWTRLGDVFDWSSGGTPQTTVPAYFGGDIPWVNSGELNDNVLTECRESITQSGLSGSSAKWVAPGSVMVAMYGANIGKLGIAGVPLTTNQAIAFTYPHPMANKFLFYYLLAKRDELISLGKGAAQKNISQTVIKSFSFVVAPLAEQHRIVAAIEQQFTRLDAGVAALRRVRAALKRYCAAVLKAAVEGTLTEAWRAAHPDAEPASALLARILTERHARWEADLRAKGKDPAKVRYAEPAAPDTASLPALPKGWCWATVEQLLAEPLCNGISVKGSEMPPGIPSLKLSAMSEAGFSYSDRRFIHIPDVVARDLAIRAGDFFVSRGNGSLHLVGRGTLAQEPDELIVFPDTMIRLRLMDAGSLPRFVSIIWPSMSMRNQIERTARTTAGIYKISQGDLRIFVLPLPPLGEQHEIVAEVERRLSVVGEVEAAIAANLKRAERLRQSILERAFSGRLVPQDPNDEPASALLERIKEVRSSTGRSNGKEARAVDVREPSPILALVRQAQQTTLWSQTSKEEEE